MDKYILVPFEKYERLQKISKTINRQTGSERSSEGEGPDVERDVAELSQKVIEKKILERVPEEYRYKGSFLLSKLDPRIYDSLGIIKGLKRKIPVWQVLVDLQKQQSYIKPKERNLLKTLLRDSAIGPGDIDNSKYFTSTRISKTKRDTKLQKAVKWVRL